MINAKYITLNGNDFIIVDELDFNGVHYMLAIDEENGNNIVAVKQIVIDTDEYVSCIKDDDEFEMVMELLKRQAQ